MKKIILGALALLQLFSCSGDENPELPLAAKKKLVAMTYNIHHGAPENSDVINLSNIATGLNLLPSRRWMLMWGARAT